MLYNIKSGGENLGKHKIHVREAKKALRILLKNNPP